MPGPWARKGVEGEGPRMTSSDGRRGNRPDLNGGHRTGPGTICLNPEKNGCVFLRLTIGLWSLVKVEEVSKVFLLLLVLRPTIRLLQSL